VTRRTVPAGTAVLIGEPAIEPVELLSAIAGATDAVSAVRSLSRCWAQTGAEPPGLVLGVDLDPDTAAARAEVTGAVGVVWSEVRPGFTVDVVFEGDGGVLATWMLQNVEPFHRAQP
jgi:hypothetical protein